MMNFVNYKPRDDFCGFQVFFAQNASKTLWRSRDSLAGIRGSCDKVSQWSCEININSITQDTSPEKKTHFR